MVTARRRLVALSSLALLLLPSVEGMAQAPLTQTVPHFDMDALAADTPGWLPIEATGDEKAGSAAVELSIWPLMYIHWFPAPDEKKLKPEQAKEVIEKLWEGLMIDSPIDVKPAKIHAHEGFVADTTIERGAMKTRYHVWLCPESHRIIVTDASMSLMVNAPAEIFGWMNDIVRTVRCHTGAPVETFPVLTRIYEVPHGDLAYSHPDTWRPLQGFRVTKRWEDWNHKVSNSEAVTGQKGRDVILPMDPLKRIELTWGPALDEPLTWDNVDKLTEEFWKGRSENIIIQERGAKGDIWYTDGLTRNVGGDTSIPPHRMHKFRVWVFRRGNTDYVVMARMAGVTLGRRRPGLEYDEVNIKLDQMLQAVRY